MTTEVMEPHFVYTVDNAYTNYETLSQLECENDVCKVDVDWQELVHDENLGLRARLELFVEAVEGDEDLEIYGVLQDTGELVVRNKKLGKDIDEAYQAVSYDEIYRHCTMKAGTTRPFRANMTDKFMSVLKGEETNITQIAYSRPVGYYSRIINWNASILGQLKDRASGRKHGSFTVTHENHLYEDDAIAVVNRYNPKV